MWLHELMDELFVKTHTWKLFQCILQMMRNILITYNKTIRSKLKYLCYNESRCKWKNRDKFLSSTTFFWKSSKITFRHIYFISHKSPRDEFLFSEKFFYQKVWVLKNILNTHHIFISSINQKLLNHLNKIIPHLSVMIRCTNTIFFFKNGIKSSNFARM